MKWHVVSGDVRLQVKAPTVDAAFTIALKTFQLDRFGMFLCGYEHGKDPNGPETWWGLTEHYLESAGYQKIGETQWKEKVPRLFNSFKRGSVAKREPDVPTPQPSVPAPTSKTVSAEPSMPDAELEKSSERENSQKSKRVHSTPPVKRVTIQRSPEEWSAVLAKARMNNDTKNKTGDFGNGNDF
jgi:hypothetical protein